MKTKFVKISINFAPFWDTHFEGIEQAILFVREHGLINTRLKKGNKEWDNF